MSRSLSIVADRQISFAEEVFSPFGEVTLVDGRSINKQSIKDKDVLLVRSVSRIDEGLLKDSSVRFVGSATSGIDHIDQDYLHEVGIQFEHAPGSNARSVAEYVLSSLFALADLQGFKLSDKTVGIIGCGQVGSRLARFLDALGATCLLNDPPLAESGSDKTFVELSEVLKADVVSLHVPLSDSGPYPTRQLVDRAFLSELKPDAILINTSRGEVVDENDLIAFKQSNPDASLVLDVWCNEPFINIDLLQQVMIATPHIAGYSQDGKLKATQVLAEALAKWSGQELNEIALPILEPTPLNLEMDDDILQWAIMQSYDIRSDAVALRNLVTLEEKEQGAWFDELRKNYPIRREFPNRQIHLKNAPGEIEETLSSLGFKL